MLKKGDFIVFGVIITVSLLLLITLFGGNGRHVSVTVDGKAYGEYSLKDDQKIEINTDYGSNTLIIKKGEAHFEDSNCPDKTCQKTGKISSKGQTIVCLPHKLIAEVKE